MKKTLILLLIVLCLLAGCTGSPDPGPSAAPTSAPSAAPTETPQATDGGAEGVRSMLLSYAQQFTVDYYPDGSALITIGGTDIRIVAACTDLGFTASNGEAKRKIAEGAVKLDDEVVTDPNLLIVIAPGATRKLSLGRKKHGVLRA